MSYRVRDLDEVRGLAPPEADGEKQELEAGLDALESDGWLLVCTVPGAQQLFVFQRYGYATALLWLLFIVVLIITLLTFKTARYWVYYEVEVEGGEP